MTEREKIVAFLKREGTKWSKEPSGGEGAFHDHLRCVECDRLAALIERGEHLKRPEPTIPASEWKNSPSVGH